MGAFLPGYPAGSRWILLAAAALIPTGHFGCRDPGRVFIPTGEFQAVIVAVEGPIGRRLIAGSPSSTEVEVDLTNGTPVIRLGYRYGLDELQIEPGELFRAEHPTATRLLPSPEAAAVGTFAEEELTFTEIDLASIEEVRTFRIEALNPFRCSREGGCLARPEPDKSGTCQLPCSPRSRPRFPEAPLSPEPPSFTPCPAGFTESEESGVTVCRPLSEPCSGEEARFLGDTTCSIVGEVCPLDGWGPDVPGESTLFVSAAPGPPGTGTRNAPFRSVAAAMRAANFGTVMRLDRGRFDETVELSSGVTVRGACVAETILSSMVSRGTEARAENLAIEGGPSSWAVSVEPATTLTLQAVVIRGPTAGPGILIQPGGMATLDRVIIADREDRSILVQAGAEATLRQVIIERYVGTGLILDGGQLDATDLIVRDGTDLLAAGGEVRAGGMAIELAQGSWASIRRAALIEAETRGIIAAGSHLELRDAVVEKTRLGAADRHASGHGLFAITSSVSLERVLFEENHTSGIEASASFLSIEDALIKKTNPAEGEPRATGMTCRDDARCLAMRLILEDQGIGLVAVDDSTFLGAHLNVRSLPELESRGVFSNLADRIDLSQVHVEDADVAAHFHSTSSVSVSSLEVLGLEGMGGASEDINISGTTRMSARRVRLVGGSFPFRHNETSRVDVEDLLIDRPTASGITCANEGRSSFSRVRIQNIRGAGLLVPSACEVEVSELAIVGVESTADETCRRGCSGVGIHLRDRGILDLRSFAVTESAGVGIEVLANSKLTAEDGRIEKNVVAARLFGAFTDDASKLFTGVLFRENETDAIVGDPF